MTQKDRIRAYLEGQKTDFKGFSRKKMNDISKITFTQKDGKLIEDAKILDMDETYNKDTYELTILVKFHTKGSTTFGETEILRQYCQAPVGCPVNWETLHCNVSFGAVSTKRETVEDEAA